MNHASQWIRILYITGVVLLMAGAIDPLEGSVILLAGSILLTVTAFLNHDRHKKFFLLFSFFILFGVGALFYFSSLGGFGGNTNRSLWWGAFILPYPAGWLGTVILLLMRGIQNRKKNTQKSE